MKIPKEEIQSLMGKVVTLNSGGPPMTIHEVTLMEENLDNPQDFLAMAECIWLDKQGSPHSGIYDIRCLKQ